YVFEDDHNSEFRYTGPPLPCLQGLDNSGRVIYAGTMSKILYPSLRLGYILAPERLVEPMIKIRAVIDQHSPAIDQATLARFLTEGFFLSHIKRMRKLYSDRREFFIEQFNNLLSKYFVQATRRSLTSRTSIVPLFWICWFVNRTFKTEMARTKSAKWLW